MTEVSAEDVLKQNQHALKNDEFGSIFTAISDEVVNMRLTFRMFESLFGSGPERIELLRRVSSLFFYYVNQRFHDGLLLQICRLTDPLGDYRGNRNLCVKQFLNFMDSDARSRHLGTLIEHCEVSSDFSRNWRDKIIAHNDFATRIEKVPVAESTLANIRAAIEDIAAIVRWIAAEFMDQTLTTHSLTSIHDEVAVLVCLHDGLLSQEQSEANSRRLMGLGDYEGAKYHYPDWLSKRQDALVEIVEHATKR